MRYLIAAIIVLAGALGANAQDADAPLPESESQRLNRLTGEIDGAREREQLLSAEAKALANEIDTLRRKAASAAASAQRKEEELTRLEGEKSRLERRLFVVRADLELRRGRLASLVAVLQRMGADPPPALIVEPRDATAAARSAMLLSAIMPYIEEEAGMLASTLGELTGLMAAIDDKSLALLTQAVALSSLRQEIDATLGELARRSVFNGEALDAEQSRLRDLAVEAKDVAALIRRLEASRPKRPLDPSDPGAPIMVLSDVAEAARPVFSTLKGQLLWPVAGEVLKPFGSEGEQGARAKGAILTARPGAQIVAPVDGRIDFSDVYRGYGNLLIMSVGGGYHILLAGFARVDCVVGQWVIAGEPIGIMGAGEDERATGDTGAAARAELYVEIQEDGVPVNPVPWFVSRGKVSG